MPEREHLKALDALVFNAGIKIKGKRHANHG
jgi:hypothetical protein